MRAEEIKKRKLYEKADFIVYAVAAAVIVFLVLFFVLRGRSSAEGIRITVEGWEVCTVRYTGEIAEADDWREKIAAERDGDILLLAVQTEYGKNEIEINLKEKWARMRDADCSARKDCTAMPALRSDRTGAIVCVPHALIVEPLAGEDLSRPSIG